MILITDSNIIISALISPNGAVAKIFKEKSNFQFSAPDYMLNEIKDHWNKIEQYSSLSPKELREEFNYYKRRILLKDINKISNKILFKAYKIVKTIDPDDVFFVALHLETGHKIWTGDKELIKGLQKKGYNIFVTTKELQKKLYKKHNNQK